MDISIHQIFYKQEQTVRLDPLFLPCDNIAGGDSDWCEWEIIRNAFYSGLYKSADLVGFVSWKFGAKTGVSGETVLKYIRENPGFDVYFVNPYHDAMVTWGFRNIWEEAEQWHKGLKSFIANLFEQAGQRIDLGTFVTRREELCYCNYWIANSRFWDAFISFAEGIRDLMESGLTKEQSGFLEHSRRSTKQGVTFRPFVMERLFSTFLALSRGRFAHLQVPLPSSDDPAYRNCARYISLGNAWKEELAERPDPAMAQVLDQYLETVRADYLDRKANQRNATRWHRMGMRLLGGRFLRN